MNFAIAEDRTDWNTLIRFDHQINSNHTWAVRWLREWAPQWYTIGADRRRDVATSFRNRRRTKPTSIRPRSAR